LTASSRNAKDDTCRRQVKESTVHCPCCWTTPTHDSQTHCTSPSLCLCRTNTATAIHTQRMNNKSTKNDLGWWVGWSLTALSHKKWQYHALQIKLYNRSKNTNFIISADQTNNNNNRLYKYDVKKTSNNTSESADTGNDTHHLWLTTHYRCHTCTGNYMSSITLAMYHRLQWFIHLQTKGTAPTLVDEVLWHSIPYTRKHNLTILASTIMFMPRHLRTVSEQLLNREIIKLLQSLKDWSKIQRIKIRQRLD